MRTARIGGGGLMQKKNTKKNFGGGILSPRGVYLVLGVYLVPGGVLSPEEGILSPRGVYLVQGVYVVLGGAWPGGVCLPGRVGVYPRYTPLPVYRILDTRLWKYYLAPNFVCGR